MRRLLPALSIILVAGLAWADTLKLAKGDVLSGRLVKLEDGVVHFRAQLAGTMMVPADEVTELSVSAPARVTKTDGTDLKGLVSLGAKGIVVKRDEGTTETIPLEMVARIEPGEPDGAPEKAKVQLETGALHRWGEDDYTDGYARLNISSDLNRYLFDADFFLERADSDDFPRWAGAGMQWRFVTDNAWRPTLGLDFERDTDKALNSRVAFHAGASRLILDDEFEVSAGLQAETTRWSHDVEDRFTNDLNARLGLRYTRSVFETGTLTTSLLFIPSLSELGDYRASAESAVAFPFADRLRVRLNLLLDYEDYPQLEELPKWRTSVGASLLWDF